MKRIEIVDSHTGGEPTRTVISGAPHLGTGSVAEQTEKFRLEHDAIRSAIVNEPRGSDVMVGALLVTPQNSAATTGVIFFNNVGLLGMCGHGTIGVIATLAHLGRIQPGVHLIETSVGPVSAQLHPDGRVSVTNVPSWRTRKDASIQVEGIGKVTGDIAWGGNWFYLIKDSPAPLTLANADSLTEQAWRIRQALNSAGHPEVDHVEFFGPPLNPAHHSRNFVLCPGKAYDRSPCGTGTSAKLACLAGDGLLAPGETWFQESIIGSVMEGKYEMENSKPENRDSKPEVRIIPTITSRAWVNAVSTLILDPSDPFCHGISSTHV